MLSFGRNSPGQVSELEKQQKAGAEQAPQKVTVDIFGDTYRLKTDNDAAYIKQLSQMVDKRMKDISLKTRTFTGARVGVLAALEFADEYCQLKNDYDALMKLFSEK